jgi:hypothetical protein
MLVDGPGKSCARGEVGVAGGRCLKSVTHAAGERDAAIEFHSVFGVEGELPLREGNERGAGGDGVCGGGSTGEFEECASVLLEAADGGGGAGGIVVGVEDGRK